MLVFKAMVTKDARLNLMTCEDEVLTIEYNHELPKPDALLGLFIRESEVPYER